MKYSIITPTYNREDCIGRCIESVVRNLSADLNFEHIIVDDGSTDRTAMIINQYASRYSHIKFIRFEYNKGTNAARNAAINVSSGDFCIILDSDDYFVDNALKTIDTSITLNPRYSHYVFVANDRMDYIAQNPLLQNKKKQVLSFSDFLSEKVTGDFVHVILTSTLLKYPFDEDLRIFEGVFFLAFYKETKNILYIDELITIRDRNRKDSVSNDYIRISKKAIFRTIKYLNLWITWFADDCVKYGHIEILSKKLLKLFENHVLVGDYTSAKRDITLCEKYGIHIPLYLIMIYVLRLGKFFRIALKSYLKIKYNSFVRR